MSTNARVPDGSASASRRRWRTRCAEWREKRPRRRLFVRLVAAASAEAARKTGIDPQKSTPSGGGVPVGGARAPRATCRRPRAPIRRMPVHPAMIANLWPRNTLSCDHKFAIDGSSGTGAAQRRVLTRQRPEFGKNHAFDAPIGPRRPNAAPAGRRHRRAPDASAAGRTRRRPRCPPFPVRPPAPRQANKAAQQTRAAPTRGSRRNERADTRPGLTATNTAIRASAPLCAAGSGAPRRRGRRARGGGPRRA
ncbi:hypothetical protein EKD16_08505 [Streptomonospora litoralis]|uniref:Uncharacterized protein n=1 Tax=Streptomonospora litoralis TaxID=2498135 RepID=A0A4P6PZ77_9ACTN|nr:hypothetical protein EKD16_08505 [Streptomonospora litoralis]